MSAVTPSELDATVAAEDSGATIRGELPAAALNSTTTLELPELSVASDGSAAFVLDKKLGEGGMGVVHLAIQAGLSRAVAVKHLRDVGSTTETAALLTEAQIMGRLEHPVIVPVHAVGLSAALGPIVVMKRIEGSPWSDALVEAELSDPDVLAEHVGVLIRVCDGVHFAHERGVVHRDLKPDNVMLGAYGEVYVVDWGVALETSDVAAANATTVIGTPAYMPPEMAERDIGPTTPASDVFLLGACLYRVLFGDAPHRRRTVLSALIAAARPLEMPAELTWQPRELVDICARACAYEAADRYPTVAAFQAALREFLRHQDAGRLVDGVLANLETLEQEPVSTETADQLRDRARTLEAMFSQALQLDPDSARAADGARRCRLVQFDAAVASDSLAEALRLSESVGPLSDTRQAGLDELKNRRATQEAAAERLAQQERRQDVRVGAAHRRRTALALFGVVALLVIGGIIWRPGDELPSVESGAITMSVVFVGWLIMLWRGRKTLFATVPNTAFTLGCTAVLLCIFVGRWIAVAIDVDPNKGLFTELLLFMAFGLQLSQYSRGFLLSFVTAAAGAVGILTVPSQTRWIVTGVILSQPIIAWYVWRGLPDPDEAD